MHLISTIEKNKGFAALLVVLCSSIALFNGQNLPINNKTSSETCEDTGEKKNSEIIAQKEQMGQLRGSKQGKEKYIGTQSHTV